MKKGKKESKGAEEATTKLPKAAAGKAGEPAVRFLPPKVFALHRAAGNDSEKPGLRVVRIEPQKAMATDGHILLTIVPAERFSVDKPFTVDAEMCAQILKAKGLSGEDATIQLSDGAGQPVITVGNYRFSPSAQLELFAYESVLEQKNKAVGKVGFSRFRSERQDDFEDRPQNQMGISWLVIGGESGSLEKVRPFNIEWARDGIRQCRDAEVACFVKQMGARTFMEPRDGAPLLRMFSHADAADPERWPEDVRIRQFPEVTVV